MTILNKIFYTLKNLSTTNSKPVLYKDIMLRVNIIAESEEEKANIILDVVEILEKEIIIKNK
jgi:indole-3-glycerol phosphate synthase